MSILLGRRGVKALSVSWNTAAFGGRLRRCRHPASRVSVERPVARPRGRLASATEVEPPHGQ